MLLNIFSVMMCSLLYYNAVNSLNFGTHLSQSFLIHPNCNSNYRSYSLDEKLPLSVVEGLNQLKESLGSDYFISREELVDGKYKLIWADEQMPLLRLDTDARERINDLERPLPYQIGDYVYVITGKLKHSRGTVLKVDKEDIGGRFKLFVSLDCRNEKGELFNSISEYHGKGHWFYESELSSTPLNVTKSPPLPGSTNYSKIIPVEIPTMLDDAKTVEEVIKLSDPINLCKNMIVASNIIDIDDVKSLISIPGYKTMISNSINYISNSQNINLQDCVNSLHAIYVLGLKEEDYPNLNRAISVIISSLTLDNLSLLSINELSDIINSLYYIGNRDIRLIGDICYLLNGMDIEISDIVSLLFSLSEFRWKDCTIVKHFEGLILDKFSFISRGDSTLLLNYLVKLNCDNSQLLDMLYQKAVTRDSIISAYPNISSSKFMMLFEAVCIIPSLYKKFLVEMKRLIPRVISESYWPTLMKMASYFKTAKERDYKYYELICSKGIELNNLTSDQSLELLELASRVGRQDIRLLNLDFSNVSTNKIGRCLTAISNIFLEYKLKDLHDAQIKSVVALLLDRFNTINVDEVMIDDESCYIAIKNLNRILISLGNMKFTPSNIISKGIEILLKFGTVSTVSTIRTLSKWSETLTVLMLSFIKYNSVESIQLDDRFILLDQNLFDVAIKNVNDHIDVNRYLITLVINSLYSMSIMGNLYKRDLSLFHEFCKNNINDMDNVHLLMISDIILKLEQPEANEWRVLFANIKKGINRITQS